MTYLCSLKNHKVLLIFKTKFVSQVVVRQSSSCYRAVIRIAQSKRLFTFQSFFISLHSFFILIETLTKIVLEFTTTEFSSFNFVMVDKFQWWQRFNDAFLFMSKNPVKFVCFSILHFFIRYTVLHMFTKVFFWAEDQFFLWKSKFLG